jgi:hypothetical protein
MKRLSLFICGVCLVASASPAGAQVISGAEIERGLNTTPNRNTIPYDGAPFSHRYGYDVMSPMLFLNGNSRGLYYQEHLDRVDRAERFGYEMPHPPAALVNPPTPLRYRFGLGFGRFFRR